MKLTHLALALTLSCGSTAFADVLPPPDSEPKPLVKKDAEQPAEEAKTAAGDKAEEAKSAAEEAAPEAKGGVDPNEGEAKKTAAKTGGGMCSLEGDLEGSAPLSLLAGLALLVFARFRAPR